MDFKTSNQATFNYVFILQEGYSAGKDDTFYLIKTEVAITTILHFCPFHFVLL